MYDISSLRVNGIVYLRTADLMAVTVNISAFWDVKPLSNRLHGVKSQKNVDLISIAYLC